MDRIISITKALADGNRLRILMALRDHPEICACQITELLGITGATVSRHLAVLAHAGLVKGRKDGRWINFSLIRTPDTAGLLTWLETALEPARQIKDDRERLDGLLALNREDICRKQRGDSCCPPQKPVQNSHMLEE